MKMSGSKILHDGGFGQPQTHCTLALGPAARWLDPAPRLALVAKAKK